MIVKLNINPILKCWKNNIKLAKLVNMSLNFIKFNNIAFLWNYFFLLYEEEIDGKKSHVQLENKDNSPNP
jgi:hypothetical protein